MAVLRRHARRQQAEHAAARPVGRPWRESGYVFTRADGTPLHPDYVSQRFRLLLTRAGLPPIRLHDLRDGAATLARAAGADLKTVQDQLGHASIAITADLYTNVLSATQHRLPNRPTVRHHGLTAADHVRRPQWTTTTVRTRSERG